LPNRAALVIKEIEDIAKIEMEDSEDESKGGGVKHPISYLGKGRCS